MLLPRIVITDVETSAITLWRDMNATELTSQNGILSWLRSRRIDESIRKPCVIDPKIVVKCIPPPVRVVEDLSGMWWGDVESDSESDSEYIE